MPTDHRAALATIKTFPQLLGYLRDEMGWPIDRLEIDELMFDYTAEELGIDAKNAPKIEEIKRLRPLSAKQPWGIFFIKFAPKRLPVLALRRILGQVVLKKRTKKSEDRAWSPDDLLFISNYGEGDSRQISFAHFSQPEEKRDLPTLKVLGWDNLDTPLHLDHVAKELTDHLSWPEVDSNSGVWREQWRAAFTLRHREVITTSRDLSIRLAALARAIRDRIKTALAIETKAGRFTKLMVAFREALVHDLNADSFADMYAQTITYGLLSARIADPHKKTADDFAGHMRTNPFLRELMETFLKAGGRQGKAGGPGIDFDELGVSEVVELLDDANMEAVVRDFGDRNRQDDPVIHFYEHFLSAYNKKLKIQSGVFYTPQPVVSYIVRTVHELLQNEFGLADGLADTATWGEMLKTRQGLKLPPLTDEPGEARTVSPDEPFVQILDPATGTATFLVEVIDIIHRTLLTKWKQQHLSDTQQREAWNAYVPQHLLPRLHAFELMMAPYAIAHMKIGLKLAETGYCFATEQRARIYLTNALEPSQKQLKLPEVEALAHEAIAVNEIKRHKRFTVIIGNPPYSASVSEPESLMQRLDDWKQGLNETKSDLNREEWKFLRIAQHQCMTTGAGIVGLIINRDFLDGIVKRRMREHLGQSFPLRIVVDLNGDVKGNVADENVFEIEQGVAIVVLSTNSARSALRFSSRVGSRARKYADLGKKKPIDEALAAIEAVAPYFRWVPFATTTAAGTGDEYAQWIPLDKVFTLKSSGIQTKNDKVCIAWSANEIFERVQRLAGLSVQEAISEFGIDGGVWSVAKAQSDLRQSGISRENVRRILYRPFDVRFTYYTHKSSGFLGRPRYDLMRHMLHGRNIGLIFNRQIVGDGVSHFSVSRDLTCHGTFYLGNKGQDYLAPLYRYDEDLLSKRGDPGTPNFTTTFTAALHSRLATGAMKPTADDVFHYIYAVFHSPAYRRRYAEFLKIDFPRLPLTWNLELFRALTVLGSELTARHLLESTTVDQPMTEFIGRRNLEIEKVSWSKNTVWVDKAQTAGFQGVHEDVWNFHIGGYQVCEKWLKDRKDRILTKDDIVHYEKIVVTIHETIRLMKDVDAVIERHGGWPGAFQTGEAKRSTTDAIPFRPRAVTPKPGERFVTCLPLIPLKAAAGAFSDPQRIEFESEWEWVAVDTTHRLRQGMFVAQVVGKSMEPVIADGAWCLFGSPVTGTREGKTVLVQLRDAIDPETGERYTVKRYESAKITVDGTWQHASITLKPANPAFEPIRLTHADEGQLQVIAEFLEVLGEAISEVAAVKPDPVDRPERSSTTRAANRDSLAQTSFMLSTGDEPPQTNNQRPPQRVDPEQLDREELVCMVRQAFSDGQIRNRDAAIRELARELGYERAGSRIRETLDNVLRTAVRRGVIANAGDGLAIDLRRIEDYERDFLKEQFLASLQGRAWKEREDSIRDFARWLGFRRTGPVINEISRSIINSLIREARLENNASSIRRCG